MIQSILHAGRFCFFKNLIDFGYPVQNDDDIDLHVIMAIDDPTPCLLEVIDHPRIQAVLNIRKDGNIGLERYSGANPHVIMKFLRADLKVKDMTIFGSVMINLDGNMPHEFINVILETLNTSEITIN